MGSTSRDGSHGARAGEHGIAARPKGATYEADRIGGVDSADRGDGRHAADMRAEPWRERNHSMTSTSTQSIRPQFRTIDALAIRYAESDPRPDDALLLNPWPESLYAYEPTWSRLAEQAHLVAIDLPGFGHSERRESLMSPRAMGEFVVRVADAFGLEQPHLVGMDVGCDAALFAAALHPAAVPESRGWQRGHCVPAATGRQAQGMGRSPRSRSVSRGRRSPDHRRHAEAIRAVYAHAGRPRGLHLVLRWRALRSSRCPMCEPTRRICR